MLGLLVTGCGVSEVLQRWVKQGLVFATGGQQPWLVSHASVPVADEITVEVENTNTVDNTNTVQSTVENSSTVDISVPTEEETIDS